MGFWFNVSAQPKSQIYVFNYTWQNEKMILQNPTNICQFNDGYNNQPFFLDNDNLLFTSDYMNENSTDIFQYNCLKKTLKNLTNTPKYKEYSPTLSSNKKSFYVVRQLDKEQAFCKYNLSDGKFNERLFGNLSTVGYFRFIDNKTCAMFLVTEPVSLVIGNVNDNKITTIATDIGRGLKLDKKKRLIFTTKENDEWILKSYKNNTIDKMGTCPSQDFETDAKGRIISSKGSDLVLYNEQSKNWDSIASLKDFNIENVTRIAINKNKIALVVSK